MSAARMTRRGGCASSNGDALTVPATVAKLHSLRASADLDACDPLTCLP